VAFLDLSTLVYNDQLIQPPPIRVFAGTTQYDQGYNHPAVMPAAGWWWNGYENEWVYNPRRVFLPEPIRCTSVTATFWTPVASAPCYSRVILYIGDDILTLDEYESCLYDTAGNHIFVGTRDPSDPAWLEEIGLWFGFSPSHDWSGGRPWLLRSVEYTPYPPDGGGGSEICFWTNYKEVFEMCAEGQEYPINPTDYYIASDTATRVPLWGVASPPNFGDLHITYTSAMSGAGVGLATCLDPVGSTPWFFQYQSDGKVNPNNLVTPAPVLIGHTGWDFMGGRYREHLRDESGICWGSTYTPDLAYWINLCTVNKDGVDNSGNTNTIYTHRLTTPGYEGAIGAFYNTPMVTVTYHPDKYSDIRLLKWDGNYVYFVTAHAAVAPANFVSLMRYSSVLTARYNFYNLGADKELFDASTVMYEDGWYAYILIAVYHSSTSTYTYHLYRANPNSNLVDEIPAFADKVAQTGLYNGLFASYGTRNLRVSTNRAGTVIAVSGLHYNEQSRGAGAYVSWDAGASWMYIAEGVGEYETWQYVSNGTELQNPYDCQVTRDGRAIALLGTTGDLNAQNTAASHLYLMFNDRPYDVYDPAYLDTVHPPEVSRAWDGSLDQSFVGAEFTKYPHWFNGQPPAGYTDWESTSIWMKAFSEGDSWFGDPSGVLGARPYLVAIRLRHPDDLPHPPAPPPI